MTLFGFSEKIVSGVEDDEDDNNSIEEYEELNCEYESSRGSDDEVGWIFLIPNHPNR